MQTSQSTRQIQKKLDKKKSVAVRKFSPQTKKNDISQPAFNDQKPVDARKQSPVVVAAEVLDSQVDIKSLPIHLRAKYIVEQREAKLQRAREEQEREKAEQEYMEMLEI